MLVLSRRVGESIHIGDDIHIVVTDIDRGKVRIGIDAPKHVRIRRDDTKKIPQETEGEDDGIRESRR